MERRFRVRLDELLDDAEVPPGLLRGVVPRLEAFLQPFVAALHPAEQRTNARHYVQGLLSDLGGKDAESIAYLHDRDRQGLQKFIGQADWDHRPLLTELARQVGTELGEPDGVLVFDPSAFPKKGTESVGRAAAVVRPARQARELPGRRLPRLRLRAGSTPWSISGCTCPRSGPADNGAGGRPGCPRRCASAPGTSWPWRCSTSAARRCRTAGSPGDDEMGRSVVVPRGIAGTGRALPAGRAVEHPGARPGRAADPPYAGRGRRPRVPFVRVDRWRAGRAGGRLADGRGPGRGEGAAGGAGGLDAGAGPDATGRASDVAEMLVVFRERQGDGTWKHDYLLSNAPLTTPLAEFARVFKAEHRIEECLKRAKGEAGLADYQVRTWEGWHHHQALSLMATWFLTQEARRGKNPDARR